MLPNNGNVLMSAEQAADHSSKTVRVVPTRSLQAGLAALVAFDPLADAETNAAAMREAVDAVATGAVTIASRDVQLNGVSVRKGKWLGLADGEPVAGGETFDEVARAVLGTAPRRAARAPHAPHRRRAARARDAARRARRPSIPSSSSTSTRAASRTIHSCWRPNDERRTGLP